MKDANILTRSYDIGGITKAANQQFSVRDWVEDKQNVALTDGEGNFILFQYEYPGAYQGHYFFGTARGKYAVKLSKEALKVFFGEYDVQLIFGLTPIYHRGALWLSRHIGFTPQDIIDTPKGRCQLFTLIRKDYETWAL